MSVDWYNFHVNVLANHCIEMQVRLNESNFSIQIGFRSNLRASNIKGKHASCAHMQLAMHPFYPQSSPWSCIHFVIGSEAKSTLARQIGPRGKTFPAPELADHNL